MPGHDSHELPPALLQSGEDARWSAYGEPLERLAAERLDQVLPLLERVEKATADGLVACGFIAYEAAAAFDPALRTHPPGDLPLAWFSLHDPGATRLLDTPPFDSPRFDSPPADAVAPGTDRAPEARLDRWKPSVTRREHADAVATIREWIAAGETYQLNYTFRLRGELGEPPEAYFAHLARRHGAGHGAWIDTGRHALGSLSPELFFRLDGDRITARPMKGTAPRGRTNAEDSAAAETLRHSSKNRAENVMIVDMVRNDLSRIAAPGSVEVPSLWDIERYPTLFQMTSTCVARSDAPLPEILRALFPSASITGAPKVRTMQLIEELETAPRGIYTGAIGSIGPGRTAHLNVAIRTVHMDRRAGTAEYGTGGGIVWDSEPDSEFAECLTKALVVTAPEPEFDLLETLRWDPDTGFVRLDRHLARLADSARYFGWRVDLDGARQALERAVHGGAGPQRMRLTVARDGTANADRSDLEPFEEPRRLALAADPIDSADRYLFHKTTHREAYERARASVPEADDAILWNERDELTESTLANLVVERRGELLTPPVACGLLPGVLRAELVESGRLTEAVLRKQDLERADALWLVSSLRGRLRAELA